MTLVAAAKDAEGVHFVYDTLCVNSNWMNAPSSRLYRSVKKVYPINNHQAVGIAGMARSLNHAVEMLGTALERGEARLKVSGIQSLVLGTVDPEPLLFVQDDETGLRETPYACIGSGTCKDVEEHLADQLLSGVAAPLALKRALAVGKQLDPHTSLAGFGSAVLTSDGFKYTAHREISLIYRLRRRLLDTQEQRQLKKSWLGL